MLYAERWPVKNLFSRHIRSESGEYFDAFKERNDGDESSRKCSNRASFSSARHGYTSCLENVDLRQF